MPAMNDFKFKLYDVDMSSITGGSPLLDEQAFALHLSARRGDAQTVSKTQVSLFRTTLMLAVGQRPSFSLPFHQSCN